MGQSPLCPSFLGLIPHSFQPLFFLKTSGFPWGSDGFLERRIPGKNGEAPRQLVDGGPTVLHSYQVVRSGLILPGVSTNWRTPSASPLVEEERDSTSSKVVRYTCRGLSRNTIRPLFEYMISLDPGVHWLHWSSYMPDQGHWLHWSSRSV